MVNWVPPLVLHRNNNGFLHFVANDPSNLIFLYTRGGACVQSLCSSLTLRLTMSLIHHCHNASDVPAYFGEASVILQLASRLLKTQIELLLPRFIQAARQLGKG
jgi:hypothetical protein